MKAILSNSLSFERVIQLCRRSIAIKKRMIMIGGAIIVGIIALLYIPMVALAPSNFKSLGPVNIMTIAFTLFTWAGYGLTSTMFEEINSAESATQYFTLPASSFEKLTSALALSYISYSILGLFALHFISLILGIDSNFIFKIETLNNLLMYTIFQSVFLFGASYFKTNNFLSTVVSILAFMIVFSIIIFVLDYVGLSSEGWSLLKMLSVQNSDGRSALIKNLVLTLIVSGFFIWMAYRRLKNRQIA